MGSPNPILEGQPRNLRTRFTNMVQRLRGDGTAQMNPIRNIAVGFILIGVALIIAVTFLEPIADTIEDVSASGNITGTDTTLLGLITTLLIVGLVAGAVRFLFEGFRNLGDF